MKKKLSLLLALVMLGTLCFGFAGPASAAGYMSLAVGNTDTITHTGYSIYHATSSNTSVLRIDSISGGIAYVTALSTGTATVTYYYYVSGVSTTATVTYYVTGSTTTIYLANVGDTDSSKEIYGGVINLKSNNTSVCRANYTDNRVKITATGVGTTTVTYSGYYNESWIDYSLVITVGGGSGATGTPISLTVGGSAYTTSSFAEVTSYSSGSPSVATVTVDYLNRIVVTPVSAGTSDITYTYRATSNGSLQTITQRATVTTGSVTTTENVSLLVGNTSNTMRYRILSNVSSNTSVATATVSGSIGAQQLAIKGVGNGTATVTVKYYDSASDTVERTITYYVTVSGGTSGTSGTTNSETSGIYFSKTSYTINKYNNGKIAGYTIRPKVDGVRVDAKTMLWLSTDTSIVTVGTKTGIIRGASAGTARIICVDAAGKYVNSFNVTVRVN